jgi:hypothetical protein
MPLALMMSYPATYVSEKKFVPSLLLSLDDILLPSKFLTYALKAYASDLEHLNSECKADKNPLISPLVATEDILGRFP